MPLENIEQLLSRREQLIRRSYRAPIGTAAAGERKFVDPLMSKVPQLDTAPVEELNADTATLDIILLLDRHVLQPSAKELHPGGIVTDDGSGCRSQGRADPNLTTDWL